ncbi:F-box only protein 2 [Petaurus breviceps papuanus]|uniref:F-box only protein 2 n=1 Tax=Petaurus breviceps papuanus TaxID=3040969 RepID=UPI0036D81738
MEGEGDAEQEPWCMDDLPDPVLIQILASLPATELVHVCRLVCQQWKALVDGPALWLFKCQQEGLARENQFEEDRDNWQLYYFLCKWKRNLLKNVFGEDEFEAWEEVETGGDGWKVEEIPGDCGCDFPEDENVKKYFVTSYEWCRKAQVVDLWAEGYWEELLDTNQPSIVVKDWYSSRSDASCLYELWVKLLSKNEDVVAEYKSETVALHHGLSGWHEISHTFTNYGPGVRFVRFEHGGQDQVYWKGWFGVRVTNSSVTVEL